MLQWYGKRLIGRLELEVTKRLMLSGEVVEKAAKKSMFINNVPDQLIVPRSKPGEAPYAQTQKLYKSIGHIKEPGRLAVRVGTDVVYGKYLETGTRKMAWRPWLVPALARSMAKIKAIFAVPIGTGGRASEATTE